MAFFRKKSLIAKVPGGPRPLGKPRGFPRAPNPAVSPLQKTYKKSSLTENTSLFGGFGTTGLAETPSIIGMGESD
jgi:hypothetical protein